MPTGMFIFTSRAKSSVCSRIWCRFSKDNGIFPVHGMDSAGPVIILQNVVPPTTSFVVVLSGNSRHAAK